MAGKNILQITRFLNSALDSIAPMAIDSSCGYTIYVSALHLHQILASSWLNPVTQGFYSTGSFVDNKQIEFCLLSTLESLVLQSEQYLL